MWHHNLYRKDENAEGFANAFGDTDAVGPLFLRKRCNKGMFCFSLTDGMAVAIVVLTSYFTLRILDAEEDT